MADIFFLLLGLTLLFFGGEWLVRGSVQIPWVDIWVMVAAAVTLVVFARTGWRLARREGACLIAAYGVYVGTLLSGAA